MVSGVCEVAPSTPKPPARLTAATTSRQWLKASRGNSIPSMSQIGDFMVLTPCGSFCRCSFCLMSNCSDDASASQAVMPSATGIDVVRTGPRHIHTSSSAKADDPVFQSAGDGIAKPPSTGYLGFAGMSAVLGAFRVAKYAGRRGRFVYCAFLPRVECWFATPEESQGERE